MEKPVRYHIVMDNAHGQVTILDTQTGKYQHPACWQDISAYYNYLVDRGRQDEAQELLAESLSGHKPITAMVEKSQHQETAGVK